MMRRARMWGIGVLFVLMDMMVFILAFWVAVQIRSLLLGTGLAWHSTVLMMRLGAAFIFFIFSLQGLYPGYGLTAVKELERTVKGVTVAFVLLAAFFYLNKPLQDISRFVVLLAFGGALVGIPLARFVLRNLLSRLPWYGVPVLVFGDQRFGKTVEMSLRRARRIGWQPVRRLALGELEQGQKYLQLAQMALIAVPKNYSLQYRASILSRFYRRVVLVKEEGNWGSLWVEPRDLEGLLGLEFQYHLLRRSSLLIKQAIDLLGGVFILLLTSPLFLLIAGLVALDSPGPVFFRQERLGKNHACFYVYKFRTMVVDAEERLQELLEKDPQARAEYEQYHKLRNDPRVTRVGRVLRKLSLDELPQLFNVVRGEMSLVGPRAYMPSELNDMGDFVDVILRVKPGMTGWWQVLGRHATTFRRRLEMDEYYISNWSIWMDFYILLKTVQVILQAKGA